MLLFKSVIIVASVIFFMSAKTNAQGFLKAKGQKIVNQEGDNILLRGVGLGGWMLQEGYMLKVNAEGQQHKIKARLIDLIGPEKTDKFYTAWLSNHTRKIDIDSMKAWGFNSVRLPMHYNLYTLPVEKEKTKAENTWLEKGFQMTDSLLAWCKSNEIYLILDLHAAPGGQGNDLNISDRDPSVPSLWDSEDNQEKTIALWKKLAQRYANEKWIGGYDILNEPNWGFEDPANDKNGLKEKKNIPLRKLMMDITTAIREVDKNHIIIIEGNGWGNNYNGIYPPWDSNMVLSFHKYWNYNTQASIQHIVDARLQYNVPVWVGETGENSNVWYTDAIQLLENNNIGWAWWPLKKLGNNNPMQMQSNPDYNKIIAYWGRKGDKPSADQTFKGIMDLAESARLENNVVKRDVIDAMFRQPHSPTSIPFKSNIIADQTILHAVDYDLGRNGIAYYDRDTANYHVSTGKREPWNRGSIYRNDGVDISVDSATIADYYVSHIEDGEWLQYTVNVTIAGHYDLMLTYAAKQHAGEFMILVNKLQQVPVELTPAKIWEITLVKNINFHKGMNEIRVIAKKGAVDFKSIQFKKK